MLHTEPSPDSIVPVRPTLRVFSVVYTLFSISNIPQLQSPQPPAHSSTKTTREWVANSVLKISKFKSQERHAMVHKAFDRKIPILCNIAVSTVLPLAANVALRLLPHTPRFVLATPTPASSSTSPALTATSTTIPATAASTSPARPARTPGPCPIRLPIPLQLRHRPAFFARVPLPETTSLQLPLPPRRTSKNSSAFTQHKTPPAPPPFISAARLPANPRARPSIAVLF
jgi:hypothetical protein